MRAVGEKIAKYAIPFFSILPQHFPPFPPLSTTFNLVFQNIQFLFVENDVIPILALLDEFKREYQRFIKEIFELGFLFWIGLEVVDAAYLLRMHPASPEG